LVPLRDSLAKHEDSEKDLMTVLKDSNRDELFESLPIMIIIDYKWQAYTRGFFIEQFKKFLCFISLFIVSLGLQQQARENLAY